MTLPNTFVVGCAKAGTTALCGYLRAHEQAFVPRLKEPSWFGADLRLSPVHGIHTEADYRALFEPARHDHAVLVDGSPSSLLSAVAARRIAAEVPDARIVVSIRNPIDVIHALHSQTVVAGVQPIRDFEEALQVARHPAPTSQDPMQIWTRYFDVVRLAEQVHRYLDAFPAEQIQVVRFDDLRADPGTVWADLQAFLGLTQHPLALDVVNPNTEPIVPAVQRLVFRHDSPLVGIGRRAFPASIRRGLRQAIYRLNVRERPRQPMTAAARELILDEIADDIVAIGTLLDWDVRDWLEGPGGGRSQPRR